MKWVQTKRVCVKPQATRHISYTATTTPLLTTILLLLHKHPITVIRKINQLQLQKPDIGF